MWLSRLIAFNAKSKCNHLVFISFDSYGNWAMALNNGANSFESGLYEADPGL